VGVKHRKDDGTNKNDNQAGKSKIFDQTKGFGPFCSAGRLHNVSVAAMNGRSIVVSKMNQSLGLINKSKYMVADATDCHHIFFHILDRPIPTIFGGNQHGTKVFVVGAELNA
jgi:hypothetical protein